MIDPMPFNFHLLCLIPESFLTITLGIMFLGIYKKWSRIMIASIIQSVVVYILVSNFDILFQSLLNYITLVIFTRLFTGISWKNSIISIAFAMAISILLKGTSTLVLLSLTGMTFMEVLLKYWLRFIFLIPYFIGLIVVIVLVRKYQFTIQSRLNTN